ncbi:MAG: hypothetical protein RIQ95_1, partial [Pseudomonadota bacterium]
MTTETSQCAEHKPSPSKAGKVAALTQQYASFIANAASITVPPDAAQRAITGFIDTIGTMIAGR